jgi:hypothetical protein
MLLSAMPAISRRASQQKADAISDKMRDHVGYEIAPRDIENRENSAARSGHEKVRPSPAGQMSERECDEGDRCRDAAASRQLRQSLDRESAVKDLFEYRRTQDYGDIEQVG